jgi:hypothetical protein
VGMFNGAVLSFIIFLLSHFYVCVVLLLYNVAGLPLVVLSFCVSSAFFLSQVCHDSSNLPRPRVECYSLRVGG